MSMTVRFVSNASVAGSSLVRLAPRIRGDRAIAHKVMTDRCSLVVRMVGNAVDLEIVDAPPCVLRDQRIVPGLPRGIVPYAPVGRIPGTGVGRVGDVLGAKRAAGNREVLRDGLPRDSADNVNAELQ